LDCTSSFLASSGLLSLVWKILADWLRQLIKFWHLMLLIRRDYLSEWIDLGRFSMAILKSCFAFTDEKRRLGVAGINIYLL
jgi:hypothetical protein